MQFTKVAKNSIFVLILGFFSKNLPKRYLAALKSMAISSVYRLMSGGTQTVSTYMYETLCDLMNLKSLGYSNSSFCIFVIVLTIPHSFGSTQTVLALPDLLVLDSNRLFTRQNVHAAAASGMYI